MMQHRRWLAPVGRLAGVLSLVVACLLVSACGKRGKTCYPVKGKVLLDGKPAKDVMVIFHPKDESDPERAAPSAQVDENGDFVLSTVAHNDGAPAGEYSVTFTWREASGLLKNQFDGPDRLKGRYADPKKNLFPVTIEPKPTELPPFNLSMK